METAKTGDLTVEYGEVGEPVLVDGKTPADGEIILDNGKTITVASGVLTEIKDTVVVEDQKKEEPNTELEKAKADLAIAISEKENLSKEVVELKAEVEKLKKAPVAKPVVKTEPKVQTVDFSKLSPIEKLAAKNGVTISPAILKRLNKK